MMQMNIHEILKHLPHRYPFVLIDRIEDLQLNKEITAIKNVTINEPFFPGHFPYHPVMPGVLIVEAMAQAAAILSFKTMNVLPTEDSVYYFAGIDNVRFKKPVSPGDQLVLNVKIDRVLKGIWKYLLIPYQFLHLKLIDRVLKGIWKYKATAHVANELVAEAQMMCILKNI